MTDLKGQETKGRIGNEVSASVIATASRFRDTSVKPSRYTVAVKVIDIFGNDTMTLIR
jgi:hypothetical protein